MISIAVVALGNRLRRDDGVGPVVLDRLAAEGLPGWVSPHWLEHDLRGLAYLDERYTEVVVLDALQFGGEPGAVRWLAVWEIESPQLWVMHDLQIPAALPRVLIDRTLILGIQPENLELGLGLSPAVAKATDQACRWVQRYLHRWKGDGQHGQYRTLGTDPHLVGGIGGLWPQSSAGDWQSLGQGYHGV